MKFEIKDKFTYIFEEDCCLGPDETAILSFKPFLGEKKLDKKISL